MVVSNNCSVDPEMTQRAKAADIVKDMQQHEINMLFTACCLARDKAWMMGEEHTAWEFNVLAGKLQNYIHDGDGGR